MAYCTNDEIAERYGVRTLVQLTDDEQTATSQTVLATAISDNAAIGTRLTRAIAAADSLIDASLQTRYLVPVSSPPQLLKELSCTLAVAHLFKRRPLDFELPEVVIESTRQARADLKAIRDGKLDLGVVPRPAASGDVVSEADGPDRLVTADTLKEW